MSDTKRMVREWAKKIGEREAVGRLVSRGVSPRAAEKLCAGCYPSEPKAIRDKLLAELSVDGFFPKEGKAS